MINPENFEQMTSLAASGSVLGFESLRNSLLDSCGITTSELLELGLKIDATGLTLAHTPDQIASNLTAIREAVARHAGTSGESLVPSCSEEVVNSLRSDLLQLLQPQPVSGFDLGGGTTPPFQLFEEPTKEVDHGQ